MKDAYNTQELIAVLSISRQAVIKRARRENWQSRARAGRGGGHEWLVASMPEATRLALAAKVCAAVNTNLPAVSSAQDMGAAGKAAPGGKLAQERLLSPRKAGAATNLASLTGAAKARADARIEATLAARLFAQASNLPYTVALEEFAARYNAGEVVLSQATRAELPSLNMSSLRRWDAQAKEQGAASLAGAYGSQKGTGLIDRQPLVVNAIYGSFRETPHVSAVVIHEFIQALAHKGFPITPPSLRQVQKWLTAFKRDNRQLVAYLTAPDKFNGRFASATGIAYENLTEYNERWEYDGTPADLMLSNGKRYTIVGIINCYSREVKFEVAERSTGRTVANLTRRCILDWGIPKVAVTDNGKEFVSNFMQGLFLDLGITPDILPPFQPRLKPAIERVFRTFSHHLLPIAPCYLGHNVATRQEIRERETFAKRLLNPMQDELSMAITPEELQAFCDAWACDVYRHKPHGGLKGKLKGMTPFEVRQNYEGEVRRLDEKDERALDVLLMDSGWREISKKGIALNGMQYDSRDLAAYIGKRGLVRVDPLDKTKAWVFVEKDGKHGTELQFVCVVQEVTGLALEERMQLAKDKKRKQMAALSAARKLMDKAAEETDAENALTNIMDMYRERARAIEAESTSQAEIVAHEAPALKEAALAKQSGEAPQTLPTGVDLSQAVKTARECMEQGEMWLPEHPQEKYELWKKLKAREASGESLLPDQAEWLQIYTESNEYRGFSMIDPERFRAVNQ